MDPTMGIVVKVMAALASPVARWLTTRQANKLWDELNAVGESESADRGSANKSLWNALRTEADLEPQALADAHGALTSPLMDEYVRMTVLEAVLQSRTNERTREVVRRGISAVLAVETGLDVDTRRRVAQITEREFYDAASKTFRRLANKNTVHAKLVQDAAGEARRNLRLEHPEGFLLHTEHLARLDPVSFAELEMRTRAYADSLVRQLETFSIPTPSREFQVDLEEAFVAAGLAEKFDDEGGEHEGPSRALAEAAPSGRSLLELLAIHSRILVFGDPGSGKSTNVQLSILKLARSIMDGSLDAVPFRITVRSFARNEDAIANGSLLDHLAESIALDHDRAIDKNTLRYLLHAGRAVVFVDGLDEVLDPAKRRDVVKKISNLIASFPGCSFVVTSRSAGYLDAPISPNLRFASFETLPFSRSEVEGYASWFFACHGLGAYRLELGVSGFMAQTEPIRDIRSNPLLLGVLCGLYAVGRAVPSDRSEIYRECAQMLFEQWDQLKGTYETVVDHDVAEAAIRALAHDMVTTGRQEVTRDDLHEFLAQTYEVELGCTSLAAAAKADRTLDLWRGRRWLLVEDRPDERGHPLYIFSHKTFLEFFAAEYEAYRTLDGKELFDTLRDWIVARADVPYVQLSIQLTSKRRAVDGELFVDAALRYVESGDETPTDRLSCAILLAEVLPSIRLRDASVRTDTISHLMTFVANWLPRTLHPSRFESDYPYAYADFRYLEPDESSLAQFVGNSDITSEPDAGEELFSSELGVNYIRLAQVILSLDHGRSVYDDLVDAWLVSALAGLESKVDKQTWIRFAVFLRAVPEMEGAERFSSAWRDYLRRVGDRVLSALAISPDDIDWADTWLVVQLITIGTLKPSVAATGLSFSDLFLGGSPTPVINAFSDGTPAHRAVEELLCPADPDMRRGLAEAILRSVPRHAEMPSLFLPRASGALCECAEVDDPIVGICCGVLLHWLARLGDSAFVADILAMPSSGDAFDLAEACMEALDDRTNFGAWDFASSAALRLGVSPETFQAMLAPRFAPSRGS